VERSTQQSNKMRRVLNEAKIIGMVRDCTGREKNALNGVHYTFPILGLLRSVMEITKDRHFPFDYNPILSYLG
jgi:hypothetical protein